HEHRLRANDRERDPRSVLMRPRSHEGHEDESKRPALAGRSPLGDHLPIVTASAVRKQIQSGATDPIYLVQGEDDVEKSALAHEFEGIVEEGLRAFNVESIHCSDVGTGDKLADAVSSLLSAAPTLPMRVPS